MKKQSSGVTLIECLVYVGLSAVLCMMLFRWWTSSNELLHALAVVRNHSIGQRLAYAIISRDVAHASPSLSDWHIENNRISYSNHYGHISYRTKAGVLYRSIKKRGAIRGNKAVIARNIASIQGSLAHAGVQVSHLSLTLTPEKGESYCWRIPLKRGARS